MQHETRSPKICLSGGVWKLIIAELCVLVLTKKHVGSWNKIEIEVIIQEKIDQLVVLQISGRGGGGLRSKPLQG